MSETIAHIDGDEVAYYIAYVNEYQESTDIINTRVSTTIEQLANLVEADRYKVYLSGRRKNSFRRRLLPAYKAHRDKRAPPRWLSYIKDYILNIHEAELHPRLEADDLLGIAISKQDDNIHIAVTQDKDIRSVPGLSFNPKKPHLGIIDTSIDEALYNLMLQVAAGDSADGYKGIPGVGLKTAAKILDGTTHRGWYKIYKQYIKKGLTRKTFRDNYICARILRRNI